MTDAHEKVTELVKQMMTDCLVSRERRNLLSKIHKRVAILYGVA